MKKLHIFWRSLIVVCLVVLVLCTGASDAQARRGGGRIGGGSFRRSPVRTAPITRNTVRNNARSPVGNGAYYGGGYGGGGVSFFPFLPFFIGGGGGGGLLTLLVLVAVASTVLQAFRGIGENGITGLDSKVTLAKIQVGLLASAKGLQKDLGHLALEADTSGADGLASILREATVSLLRHPEYWIYVRSAKEISNFDLAEQKFQGLALSERSKLSNEVLSNVNNRIKQAPSLGFDSITEDHEDPTEYVVVTLLVAATGNPLAKIPADIRSANDLQLAIAALGSIPADQLLALEILWEPKSEDYTLSADQVLSVYPDLVRL